jgi:phage terminase large subunit-like protein
MKNNENKKVKNTEKTALIVEGQRGSGKTDFPKEMEALSNISRIWEESGHKVIRFDPWNPTGSES